MNNFIRINSLEVFGYHGTIKEEGILGQKYFLNLNIELRNSFREICEDLSKTVDYSQIIIFVRKYFEENRRDLLETIANDMIFEIFKSFNNIYKIDLEIFKPGHHVALGFDGMSVFCSRKIHKVYIALGSNLGNREENLNSACELMENRGIKIIKKSNLIETEPYGDVVQDKFLNSVIYGETILNPSELMEELLKIESELKRERVIRWGPRTIDLDILLYDEEIINEENVVVPHYDMQNRNFVLEPLCEINRFAYNPRLCKFAFEMLNDLNK